MRPAIAEGWTTLLLLDFMGLLLRGGEDEGRREGEERERGGEGEKVEGRDHNGYSVQRLPKVIF